MPFPAFAVGSAALAVATMAVTLVLAERRWLAVGAGFAGATALLLFHGPVYFDFYHDDAYITLRYSRHLADGLGPNWNSTGRVEGYTTFLWMATLAALAKLGFDLVDTSRVLDFLSILGTFAAVFGIWKLWSEEDPESGVASPVIPVAVFLGLALTDGVAFWGFSGMETPLFMALVTAGAYCYFRERRGGMVPWSAVVIAAAALARPEGLVVAAVTGAFVGAGAMDTKDRRRAVQKAALWGAVFLLLYGSYFLWRYSYYDYLLPNTYYAKSSPSVGIFSRGLGYITTAGLNYHLIAMFAGALVLLGRARLRHDSLYIIALTGALLAGIVFDGGDDFGHGRFITPMLPLLFLGGLAGFGVLLKRAAFEPMQAALVATVALSLAGLSLLPHSYNPALARGREADHERSLIGTWLNEHTPPDYTIAAYAIGAISYYGHDRAFLDLLGLSDVMIAHTHVPDLGSGLLGHEKYNIDYVLDVVRPEIIVVNDADERALTKDELRHLFSIPSPVEGRNKLLTDPRLWERYEARSLNINGKWFNFLQRADTVDELQGPGLQ